MLIRQSAFTCANKMLKGGLHCHTTRSDGSGSPEEVTRLYAKNGYDFLAVTDHRRYNRINFAPDTGITTIPGMEFDAYVKTDGRGFRCFHTVTLGSDDGSNPFLHDQRFSSDDVADQEEYQKYLDMLHSANQLTVYCHPEWSSTPARYFERMRGNFAMEIWNTGCVMENGMDENAAYWDELLGQGRRIFGIASDDGHPMEQHCRGWVMVNSDNSVPSILLALENGDYYSTCAPVIYDFYVEDGVAHIKCSPCDAIQFIADRHPTSMLRGKDLTHYELDLCDGYDYIRASVIDSDGRRAWTNPIFLTE